MVDTFEDLKGTTLASVKRVKGEGDELHFMLDNGETYKLYHAQDCCEDVRIEDITGDVFDLIGVPILMAEEAQSDPPARAEDEYTPESETWTFYKLATIKGYVTIRWWGTSNGCYSESVDWAKVEQPA